MMAKLLSRYNESLQRGLPKMNLETSKNLGGVGALLVVIGGLAFFGSPYAGLLDLIGVILMLIAMKGFADNYKESGIFNNVLYGFILTIIGVIVAAAIAVVTILSTLVDLGIDFANPSGWVTQFPELLTTNMDALFNIITGIVAAGIVVFIFAIVSAILYRKSLGLLASKTAVGMFSTAGLLLLIGAVLTIVLIGFILIWIAFILIAVAFFSVRPQVSQQPAAPLPS